MSVKILRHFKGICPGLCGCILQARGMDYTSECGWLRGRQRSSQEPLTIYPAIVPRHVAAPGGLGEFSDGGVQEAIAIHAGVCVFFEGHRS